MPPRQGSTASGRAESGGLRGFHPGQSFQPSGELIAVTPAPSEDPRDFLPAQGSVSISEVDVLLSSKLCPRTKFNRVWRSR